MNVFSPLHWRVNKIYSRVSGKGKIEIKRTEQSRGRRNGLKFQLERDICLSLSFFLSFYLIFPQHLKSARTLSFADYSNKDLDSFSNMF